MGRKTIERIKYWAQILLLPMYGLSFLFPRNRKIWVFGSTFGRRFADNPRYFYLYVSQHRSNEITPVWISRNKEIIALLTANGYKAYEKNSIKGIFYCLRGGIYLYDNYPKDISHFLSGGAIKVNLWHGLPLKKIQNDNLYDYIRHPRNMAERISAIPRRISDEKPSHYVLTNSSFFTSIFSSAFQTKKVLISGYPRCDVFLSDTIKNLFSTTEIRCYKRLADSKKQGIKKIILYMPTFRDTEAKFFETIFLEEFQAFLSENQYLFCTKLHCKSKLNERFSKIHSNNICIIPSEADPYCYIGISDLLITDYSSIYFDYLLTDKPIVFFDYDYQEYISQSRELYFSYEDFTPGPKVQQMKELEEVIKDIFTIQKDDSYKKKREQLKHRLFEHTEITGSQDLYQKLLNIRKKDLL